MLTLLTVPQEWLTTQLALDVALPVSVLGTMDSWLYAGLLVGRTEEQNKTLWGSQPAGLVVEKAVFAYCVPCGQCLSPLDDFTAGFSWKIHYHLSPAHLVFC